MATYCPNYRKKRKVAVGGGTAGCNGRLEVRLIVSVSLPFKGWGRKGALAPTFETALGFRWKKYGVRVPPQNLAAVYADARLMDIHCNKCDWSMRQAVGSLKQSMKIERKRSR